MRKKNTYYKKINDEPQCGHKLSLVMNIQFFISQKRAVKSIDRMILASLKIKCPQNQCSWTGCIQDYEVSVYLSMD